MAKKENGEKRYFAAANTGAGFKSYYGNIFVSDKMSDLIIVKGGSGTGKSSFIKKLSERALKEEYEAEFFYCSSDPDSLDGVILTREDGRRIAALDGTSPHIRDTELPGCCDFIHNTGAYWNREKLAAAREEISEISAKRSKEFLSVYNYLSAGMKANCVADEIIASSVNTEKMGRAADRLLKKISGDGGGESIRLIDSFGMKGNVKFDTFAENSECVYRVVGYGAHLFLEAIKRVLREKGIRYLLSPYHLDTEKISAIYLPGSNMSFTAEKRRYVPSDNENVINMERFVKLTSKENGRAIKQALKLKSDALAAAETAFSNIRSYHFKLEKIYSEAMDFDRKNSDEKQLIDDIFKW